MQKMSLNEIREKYLSFFESKGHLRLPSFPLIPQGDNSLLLINAGMAPLKPYFSGEVTPPRERVTTCQKCIRTPDIERVGKTARHGTFFEMLGNFSFGDYFKHEATAWAWEFCTKVMELPPEKLYISVFEEDDEAWDIWTKEVGVDPSHMVRLGKEDNFWEIGSGPCGPCSEIYFDRGEKYGCGRPECAVGCDCDRFVEFWNLVFTQFNGDGNGNYAPLPKKNIDTGMGLERLACIMQDVDNLFEVDTIREIMLRVCEFAGVKYGDSKQTDVSLRVITDHIRSTTMLVCDGVLPLNEGRGYVLRRLLRRAARHGKLLGITKPFLFEVCRTVIEESAQAYPELKDKSDYITRVIRMEEERFDQTIDAGLRMLLEDIRVLKDGGQDTLTGAQAFKLYDTFGFPVDLTLEILDENKLKLDREAFETLMQEQRVRARTARSALGDMGWAGEALGLSKDIKTLFTGYEHLEDTAAVLAIVSQGELRPAAVQGEQVTVVLDKTPFYAESGGQVTDTGTLVSSGAELDVTDVRKTGDGKYLHLCTVDAGQLNMGDSVRACVDKARRAAIMRAHSATHLLQKALRETLGTHVEQAGSLVEPDRLRFDFTHYTAITEQELEAVALRVNEKILEGTAITVKEMPIDEAKKLGAMALFGEKYGQTVRVVRMGDYSTEFCGGTHIDNTARIGSLAVESESSVAAGVRRIEARVGLSVLESLKDKTQRIEEAAGLLKTSVGELGHRIEQTLAELKQTRRELEKLRSGAFIEQAQTLLTQGREIGGVKAVSGQFAQADAETLRKMGDWLRDKDEAVAAVLASTLEGKITFLAVCGKEAVKKGVRAGDLIKAVTAIAGGTGGGRPDSAMGGGRDADKLGEALGALEGLIKAAVQKG